MKPLIALFLFTCTLYVACKQQQNSQHTTHTSTADYEENTGELTPHLVLDSLASYLRARYPSTPDIIIRRYGTPLQIDSFKTQNVHTGKDDDRFYKFQYRDKTIAFYYASEMQQYFIELIELKNVNELSPLGITDRTTPNDLRILLGPEHAVHQSPDIGTVYRYTLTRDVEEHFLFIFKGSTLTSFQYQPYLD